MHNVIIIIIIIFFFFQYTTYIYIYIQNCGETTRKTLFYNVHFTSVLRNRFKKIYDDKFVIMLC